MNIEAPTNVLIIGGGGREDALAWKMRQSPQVGEIFVTPGNGGTERLLHTSRVPLFDYKAHPQAVTEAAKDYNVGLVIIGPEDPLAFGLADILREGNIFVYGPGKSGAILEASKAYAAEFMEEFGIPQPQSKIFTDFESAVQFTKNSQWGREGGIVVKADGLAAGKGVFVCDTAEQAEEALVKIMQEKEFGDAGNRVVMQKKEKGFEVSVMAVVSGDRYTLLPFSEDHKQVFDKDQGPNTGGMGVAAPHQLMNESLKQQIEETIIKPTLAGLRDRGIDFRGTLYPGIMVTDHGPVVLEYNVRFGDPETEAIIPLFADDLFPTLKDAAKGNLVVSGEYPVRRGASVTVALASAGYPGSYEKGRKIFGLDTATGNNVIVFHAGTQQDETGAPIKTSGGRVLFVTGLGDDIGKARQAAYGVIGPDGVHFDGMHHRTDIGARKRK